MLGSGINLSCLTYLALVKISRPEVRAFVEGNVLDQMFQAELLRGRYLINNFLQNLFIVASVSSGLLQPKVNQR